jgi:glutamyl-tRNA synthetase
VEAEALVAYLARLGSSEDPVLLPFDEQAAVYDLSCISRSAARFDTRQLLALNHKLLATLPFSAVADRLPQGATEAFWLAIRGNIELLSEARLWFQVVMEDIIPPVQDGEDAFLAEAASLLPAEPWDETTWKSWTAALRERTGRSGKTLFHPLRLALTGEEQGPELRDLLPLMSRARVLARLKPGA